MTDETTDTQSGALSFKSVVLAKQLAAKKLEALYRVSKRKTIMTDESREATAFAVAQKMWASAITEAGHWRFEETAIIELGKAVIERTTRVLDDLRARLAAAEQERDRVKELYQLSEEDRGKWIQRCNTTEIERDAALAEVKALRATLKDITDTVSAQLTVEHNAEVKALREALTALLHSSSCAPGRLMVPVYQAAVNAAFAVLDAKEKP